jgi:hypothetical protein
MLVRRHAPPLHQLLGAGMTAQQQILHHANFKVFLDVVDQPRKLCVKLAIANQLALLIPIATTEKPSFVSKKDYGSGSDTCTLLQRTGFKEQITWQAPLR